MSLQSLQGLADLAKVAQSTSDKEILTISVDEVVSRDQVRKRFTKIDELAASIESEGQQSPIIVSPQNDDGKYPIQKGERRWRAIKHAGIGTIDVIVNRREQSALDETAGELIENIQREDLAPVEIAHALYQFIEAGWKQKDIAARLGKSEPFVSSHLSLRRLPDCVIALYEAGVCSDAATLNNLRLLHEINPERCETLCQVSKDEGVTRKESRTMLEDARRIEEAEDQAEAGASEAREQPTDDADSEAESEAPLPWADSQGPVEVPPAANADSNGNVDEDSDELGGEADESDSAGPASAAQETGYAEDEAQGDPSGANESADAHTGAWEPARADDLVFVVTFNLDGQRKRGVVMMDRVSKQTGQVWVSTLDDRQKEIHAEVDSDDIQLVSVKRGL